MSTLRGHTIHMRDSTLGNLITEINLISDRMQAGMIIDGHERLLKLRDAIGQATVRAPLPHRPLSEVPTWELSTELLRRYPPQ